ncbi:MAG: hypothetical protein D8M59_07505 [Planctomycetes bacterium]|nr:hypothetical protein [Planctomycetota bacterium]
MSHTDRASVAFVDRTREALVWLRYAETLALLDRRVEAVNACQRALENDPNVSRAQLLRDVMMAELGLATPAERFGDDNHDGAHLPCESLHTLYLSEQWPDLLAAARRERLTHQGRTEEVTALAYELVAMMQLGMTDEAVLTAGLLRYQATVTPGLIPALDDQHHPWNYVVDPEKHRRSGDFEPRVVVWPTQ